MGVKPIRNAVRRPQRDLNPCCRLESVNLQSSLSRPSTRVEAPLIFHLFSFLSFGHFPSQSNSFDILGDILVDRKPSVKREFPSTDSVEKQQEFSIEDPLQNRTLTNRPWRLSNNHIPGNRLDKKGSSEENLCKCGLTLISPPLWGTIYL